MNDGIAFSIPSDDATFCFIKTSLFCVAKLGAHIKVQKMTMGFLAKILVGGPYVLTY